jgi:hypothetical protein
MDADRLASAIRFMRMTSKDRCLLSFWSGCVPWLLALAVCVGTARADEESEQALETLVAARREVYEERMETLISVLKDRTGLDARHDKVLKEAAHEAVEEGLERWQKEAPQWIKERFPAVRNLGLINQQDPVETVKLADIRGMLTPDDLPVWEESLKKILTEDQWAVWKAHLEAVDRQMDQQVRRAVRELAEGQRAMMEQNVGQALEEIVRLAGIDEARGEALRERSAEAVEEAVTLAAENAYQRVMGRDRLWRETFLPRSATFGLAEQIQPQDQPAWKAALDEVLKAEDVRHLEEVRERQEKRRLAAARGAVLMSLDQRLWLSHKQYAALEKVVTRAAETLAESMRGQFYQIDLGEIGSHLEKTDLNEVRAILTNEQSTMLDRVLGERARRYGWGGPPGGAEKLSRPTSDFELNQMVTEVLLARYRDEVERLRPEFECIIAALGESVGLSRDSVLDLQVAAGGAIQDSMESVRQRMVMSVQSNLSHLSMDQVTEWLANINVASFGVPMFRLEDSPVWLHAVDQVLNDKKKQLWRESIEERIGRTRAAQKALVMFEVNRVLLLSEDLDKLLSSQLDAVFEKHGQAMDDITRRQYQAWHANNSMLLLPLAGVPKEQFAELLSEEQKMLLYGKLEQVRYYWQQVEPQPNLDQRRRIRR